MMGLLVGLPLKLFALLFALFRVALPVLVVLAVIWVLRRIDRRRDGGSTQNPPKEPDFRGPVYTVDYEEVREKDGEA